MADDVEDVLAILSWCAVLTYTPYPIVLLLVLCLSAPLLMDIAVPLLFSLSTLFGLGVVKGVFLMLLVSGLCATPAVVVVLSTRAVRSPVWALTLVLLALALSSVSLTAPLMVLSMLLLLSLLPVFLSSTSGRMAMVLLLSSILSSSVIVMYASCHGSWSSALTAYLWVAVVSSWAPVLVAGALYGPAALVYVMVVLPKIVIALLLLPSVGLLLASLACVLIGW